MQKLLPNKKGFTLIELLVVVSIIAILAVIAATIYSGIQQRARNARRQSDILAIAKAYEAQRVPGSAQYPASATSWFAGGAVPAEPAGWAPQYSICYITTAGTVARPAAWGVASANPTCPAGSTAATVAAGLPALNSFQICALLEPGTTLATDLYCVANAQ